MLGKFREEECWRAAAQTQVDELKKKDPVVVGVFGSASDAAFKAFEAAAGALWSDFDFGHTFDTSLVSEVRQEELEQGAVVSVPRALHGWPALRWSAVQAPPQVSGWKERVDQTAGEHPKLYAFGRSLASSCRRYLGALLPLASGACRPASGCFAEPQACRACQ